MQLVHRGCLVKMTFSRVRRNSQWIYSNRAEEMAHARKGRLFIANHPGHDVYNCTLRIHKTLEQAHLVLSQHPKHTAALLRSLACKQRFQEQIKQEQDGALEVVTVGGKEVVSYNREEEKRRGLESVLEQSKHLEMMLEVEKINKGNNDRENRLLRRQQEELSKFMQAANIREKLESFRKQKGTPRIVDLLDNYQKISELRNGGINIFCFLDESHAVPSKTLFTYLEQQQIPYQILPSTNNIVNLLAASGFPADRFAIEYYPKSISSALQKRKPMKMTVGMIILKKDLITAIQRIKSTYGGEQMIYLEDQNGKMFFRGRAAQFQNQCLLEVKGEQVRVAIAPFISTFNQELKQERNRIGRLYGEAMSDTTHFVRMQFINQELKQLLKRKDIRNVSVNAMLQELIARTGSQKAVLIGAEILGVGQNEIKELIRRAQGETVKDHLGLQELAKKK